MDLRIANGRTLVVIACAVVGLIASAPVAAAADELSPIEILEAGLLDIQNHLTNMSMKLKLDLRGGGTANQDLGRPPTVGEACCSGNIKTIRERLNRMRQTVDQLQGPFAAAADSKALTVLDNIRAELTAIARGVAFFQQAKSTEHARGARLGLTKPFNRLRGEIERLKACCPLAKAAPARPQRKK